MEHFAHLAKDRRLKKLLDQQEKPLAIQKQTDMVFYLCASIMSQQLSTKVAHSIRQRYLEFFGGLFPTPEQILTTDPTTLRAIGLSNAKVSYVLNVARFAIEHGMNLEKLESMDNESVIVYLTQIKGVGRWTEPFGKNCCASPQNGAPIAPMPVCISGGGRIDRQKH